MLNREFFNQVRSKWISTAKAHNELNHSSIGAVATLLLALDTEDNFVVTSEVRNALNIALKIDRRFCTRLPKASQELLEKFTNISTLFQNPLTAQKLSTYAELAQSLIEALGLSVTFSNVEKILSLACGSMLLENSRPPTQFNINTMLKLSMSDYLSDLTVDCLVDPAPAYLQNYPLNIKISLMRTLISFTEDYFTSTTFSNLLSQYEMLASCAMTPNPEHEKFIQSTLLSHNPLGDNIKLDVYIILHLAKFRFDNILKALFKNNKINEQNCGQQELLIIYMLCENQDIRTIIEGKYQGSILAGIQELRAQKNFSLVENNSEEKTDHSDKENISPNRVFVPVEAKKITTKEKITLFNRYNLKRITHPLDQITSYDNDASSCSNLSEEFKELPPFKKQNSNPLQGMRPLSMYFPNQKNSFIGATSSINSDFQQEQINPNQSFFSNSGSNSSTI